MFLPLGTAINRVPLDSFDIESGNKDLTGVSRNLEMSPCNLAIIQSKFTGLAGNTLFKPAVMSK